MSTAAPIRASAPTSYPREWDPVLAGRFLLRRAQGREGEVAVVSHGRRFTYGDLVLAGETYERSMRDAGLRHGDAVVVRMDPGFESVATFLACSEAGFVFVPVNAASPPARVAGVCEAVEARCMVRGPGSPVGGDEDSGRLDVLAGAEGPDLHVDVTRLSPDRPDRRVLESDPSYVIFTSGSTGAPKGIVMTHRAVVVAFRGIVAGCRAEARLASPAPLGFDFTLLDTAAALGTGRTILFLPPSLQLHPGRLVDFLRAEAVQQLHCVPSLLSTLLRHCADELASLSDLRCVLTAGEELTPATVRALRRALPGLRVVNCYGQTESICCTFYDVPDPVPAEWSSLPIGDAYPGAEVFLVDAEGNEVAGEGVAGELYLRAASLFSGYWRAPEETHAALVPDPLDPGAPAPVLRTGDLGVRTPDGIVFAGRRDHQVQMHGHRVELEEIERCLMTADGVAAAGVAYTRDDERQSLVAFVVGQGGRAPSPGSLRAHCRRSLPDYMTPGRVFFVDALPSGATGKLDRHALAGLAAERMAGIDGKGVAPE